MLDQIPERQGYLNRQDLPLDERQPRSRAPWIYEYPLAGADIFTDEEASSFLTELAELLGSDIARRAGQIIDEQTRPETLRDTPAVTDDNKGPDYPFRRGLPKFKFPPLK